MPRAADSRSDADAHSDAVNPLVLVAGALALLGLALGRRPSNDPRPRAGARVVLIGDSHLHNVALGAHLIRAVRARKGDVVGVVQNNGWSEAKYRTTNLAEQLRPLRPTVAVVVLGGNNYAQGEAYKADLDWMLRTLRGAGVTDVVWIGPATARADIDPATAQRHDATTTLQRQYLPDLARAHDLRLRWMDSRGATLTGHRGDGVHFTSAGYAAWASGASNVLTWA